MRLRSVERLRRVAQQFKRKFTSSALILLYHRVAKLPSDPQLLCVTPEHFAEHLEVLRKHSHPTRLQGLTHELMKGKLPPRRVIVTFDDGYADNLHNAKPLLERYDVPATVFVTSGYIGGEQEFWWDELDRLLLQPGSLPGTLHLNINGISYCWDLEAATNYSEDIYQRHCNWNIMDGHNPSARHLIYRSLQGLLRSYPEKEQQKILKELAIWSDTEPTGRPTYRSISSVEIHRLVEGGLVDVGAHTVTHPVLSTLSLAAQMNEIRQSKDHLEEILGSPIISFAYPYGLRSDYTLETVAAVREAGFVCACSNFPDLVQPSTDQFQLPRFLVRDWDGDEFERQLRKWFQG